MGTPGSHQLTRGDGAGAYNSWPTLPKLEALRDEWLAADDATALARRMQEQALDDVPYLPLGSYYQPVAYRGLTGVPKELVQFTGVRKG